MSSSSPSVVTTVRGLGPGQSPGAFAARAPACSDNMSMLATTATSLHRSSLISCLLLRMTWLVWVVEVHGPSGAAIAVAAQVANLGRGAAYDSVGVGCERRSGPCDGCCQRQIFEGRAV